MGRLLAGLDLKHLVRKLGWRPILDQHPVELVGGHPEEPLLVDPHLVDEQHARIRDESRDLAGRVDLLEPQLVGVAGVDVALGIDCGGACGLGVGPKLDVLPRSASLIWGSSIRRVSMRDISPAAGW